MVRFLTFSLCLLASAIVTSQASAQVNVTVQNQQRQTIYVAFTLGAGQVPGPINWGNCAASVSNNQVAIGPGVSCNAVVPTASSSSRFCASTSSMGTTRKCYNAQANHQTMVETTFGSYATNCYPTSMASCVWYDISVIPQNCTDVR